MRRFVGLLLFLFFAFPLGFTVIGCGHGSSVDYCNGSGYGPTTGQVAHITLASTLTTTGESLNYGQIGTTLNAAATDCHGAAVTVNSYTYATTDMSIADVNPANGEVCAGTWNRNTGGGIANYTVCTPPANPTNHTAQITATASGAVSNPIEIYIHPTVTGVVLGLASTNCPNNANSTSGSDPATNCSACYPNTTGAILPTNSPVYDGSACYSQNQTAQLVARVYANGTTNTADNITCQVGPLSYALQGSTNIASISASGLVTFAQPGSALVTTTVSRSSSALSTGYVSTCPPSSITLTPVNGSVVTNSAGDSTLNVAVNTAQQFTATVLDTNKTAANNYQGNPITDLSLEFNSTLPVNFPTNGSSVTPAYPGSATITAACVPPSCNPAPFSQIGLFGNGQPVTSNGVNVTAPGTVSTVLYMGSTNSQYLQSEDFTIGQLASPVRLPFTPTSMVISQDGSTIYMGSAGGLMVFNTAAGTVSGTFEAIQGNVLAVAPNDSYAVVTDPTRDTVSLVTSAGAVFSTFNGVGNRAQWAPDSNTLYVAANNRQLLTWSSFIGWESTTTDETYSDVAVTVPHEGAYFAGTHIEGRSYCASSTEDTLTTPASANNVFYPLVDATGPMADRVVYTTDGKHLLGATATSPATLEDVLPVIPTSGACPQPPNTVQPGYFQSTSTAHPLAGITVADITGVVASSASNVAFVTFDGTGGALPLYVPSTGTLSNVTLSGGAVAPVAGVFSTDNTTFYAGTSGDNLVHIITITNNAGTDSGTIPIALPAVTGSGNATPNLIVQRVRRAIS